MNNLTAIEPRDLYLDPTSMRPALAVAKHMAETAALMRRWPEMEAAIDILIERQQVILQWWDDHVRPAGHQPNISAPEIIGTAEAERTIGVGPVQISRIRSSLANGDAYRARLISRVMREAGLSEFDDPTSRRPTPRRDGPDFWPTPVSLITGFIDHVLRLLPSKRPIWECAAGDGRLAKAIAAAGSDVLTSDLYPQDGTEACDFLHAAPPRPDAIVVTNPPYNNSDAFIERGLALMDEGAVTGLVLLLRHDHLQAGSRVGAFNRATREIHCNWRPIWIDGTEGQPRWSFHWVVWTGGKRLAPLYFSETKGGTAQ